MSTSESFEALRRANPRSRAGFAQSVDAVRARIAVTEVVPVQPARRRRGRFVRLAAVGAALAVAAGVAAVTVRSPGGGPGVEDAAAVVRKAATVTAAAAERSGTAAVRITHDGEPWAGSTIRWNGDDLSVTSDAPDRAGKAGRKLLVVGGTVYGRDPGTGEWWAQGSPANIDPESGTNPSRVPRRGPGGRRRRDAEEARSQRDPVLDQSRERRLDRLRGKVTAGSVARETGFKEGQSIRVFPFGYVAHDEAADPDALLDAALTVGAHSVVREIALSWGQWTYVVTYSGLGSTPALVAPKNARSLLKERLRAVRSE